MSLSTVAIRRPVFAWMVMAALLIFGGIAFFRLGISQMPDVDFPIVNISLNLTGAAPEIMESQVVDIIEDAVMGIQGISNVTSTARQNSATVTIEFDLDKDIDVAVQEVQTRIAQVRSMLPEDLDPPTIQKTNPEDQPIMWMVLTSDGTIPFNRQMMYARDVLFDRFATLDGVGDIILGGYVDPNMRVWVSNSKLRDQELTVSDVIASIKANHREVPAGRIENSESELNVRILGEATTPEDFAKIPLTSRGGRANYRSPPLSTVARIEEGLADVRRIARYVGKQSVGLGVLKQHGSNAIQVVEGVRARLEEVKPLLPKGLALDIRVDNSRFIRDSVHELNFALVMSAILTSVVCFVFLGSWSSTFNVLMAIPTSIIGAFIVLYFLGFTLNTYTLLGLSLAVGIVVDDAIMMLENIMRHFAMGKSRVQASIDGANEITFPAVAATLAVVAIFLPVVFMKGLMGRYFFQYGITVTAAVLLSLLEALMLTPMRSSRMLQREGAPVGDVAASPKVAILARALSFASSVSLFMDRLAHAYRRVLKVCLRWRWVTLAVAIGLFVASLSLFKRVPGEMVPAQDQSQFLLRVKTPVGSSISFTNEKTKQIEAFLATVPEIEGFYAAVGGFQGDAVNEAMIFVSLVPPAKRQERQAEVMNRVRNELNRRMNAGGGGGPAAGAPPSGAAPSGAQASGVQIFAQDLSLRSFSASRGFPIEFSVQGPDWRTLGQATSDLMTKLKASGVLVDVNSDYQINMPELSLLPDRQKAAARGVPISTVAQTVNALMGGVILGSETRYFKDGHRYDIRVRLVGDERDSKEDLHLIDVRNIHGEIVPLSELTTIEEQTSLQMVTRRNRERAISVFANVAPGHSQQEALEFAMKAAKENLPDGYHAQLTGGSQAFKDSMRSLVFAFVLGIVVSYMVLASQFNSFIHPVTILMALPFSISGAIFALFIGGQSINMFSMIGFILLMGIVKKNSILLVEFTNHLRSQGLDPKAAILEACPIRLRPILMTSVATIAGALPEALSIGPGSETLIPMATAIIGGVIASTLLTLFVVPCVYSVFVFFERRVSA